MRDELAVRGPDLACRFLFDGGLAEAVLREALAEDVDAAQLSPAFRAYYRLRSIIPLPIRQLLQRYRSVEQTRDWYLAHCFERSLAAACKLAGESGLHTIHPWPHGARFAFVPTHDVETAEGMRRIERIANLEEDLGFRSSWNVVPHKYRVDRGLVRDLQARGFEIGVHGYNHDGKLFTSRAAFDSRVSAINAALNDFGAVGFRAPMVHRNLQWMQALDIEYDASCFDTDPYQAMPGGIGSVWPFIAGRFVELPYTLPQDHTLFIALGERDCRIWKAKFDHVTRLGGMALLITHPDYLDPGPRLDAYRGLLEHAREAEGVWQALPRQVAAWWRERDQSKLEASACGGWQINGPAAECGRAAAFRTAMHATPPLLPTFEWRDLPTIAPVPSPKVSAAIA
jgi:peptidoglycan/xylan/chitin deacetylase (PgdA/CDA1 family)